VAWSTYQESWRSLVLALRARLEWGP
jgi:hypothetical protein